MPQKALDTSVPQVLLTGLAMGESPRWRDGRLWLSDWGAQEILAVDPEGRSEVILRVPFLLPFCFDWLPQGSLVVVSGREGRVLRRDPAGSLTTYADLTSLSRNAWNEIVVDGRGNAYVNTADAIALVTPGGSARQVADGGAFPNGMAVTPDNSTLIMAESHGRKLTALRLPQTAAFPIAACGPTSVTVFPTAFASTRKRPCGTRTCPTSGACASGRAARYCRRSPWIVAAFRARLAASIGKRCS